MFELAHVRGLRVRSAPPELLSVHNARKRGAPRDSSPRGRLLAQERRWCLSSRDRTTPDSHPSKADSDACANGTDTSQPTTASKPMPVSRASEDRHDGTCAQRNLGMLEPPRRQPL